jgi:hypothetical protein
MKNKILLMIIVSLLCVTIYAQSGTPGLAFTLIDGGTAYEVYQGTADATHIEIPPTHNGLPVTSIASMGFESFTTMTSITIPNSVTTIGPEAFRYCIGLTSITIPNSVTTIGPNAFSHCTSLTSITIPNSVITIDYGAFQGCTGLTEITIPNSVTRIGTLAFSGTSLTEIVIPNSVTYVGQYAFSNCAELTSVTIGNSVNLILPNPFRATPNLETIIVDAGNTHYRSEGNSLIRNFENTLISGTRNSIIPDSVTKIGDAAFMDCTGLVSITIPNSVTIIAQSAFWNATDLTEISIPNSVSSIWRMAFYGTGIWNNTPDNSIVYADRWIVGYKGEIPNGILEIESDIVGISHEVFAWRDLTSVTFESPSSLKYIGAGTFSNNGLTSIAIPSSVTILGESSNIWFSTTTGAFEGCTGLTSITFEEPSNLTKIDRNTFRGCIGLTEISIPNSVTSIGHSAFYETGIWNNTPNNSVVYADRWIVGSKGTLSSGVLEFESDIIGISDNAFVNRFTDWTLVKFQSPSVLTSIGRDAFSYNWYLTSIYIPLSVTFIDAYAFDRCTSLTIYAAASDPAIDPNSPAHGWSPYWNGSRPVVWGHVVSDCDITIEVMPATTLVGNFPNPFNPTTSIQYQVSGIEDQLVRIDVYNIKGQLVRTLVNDMHSAGEYSVVWNGTDGYGRSVGSGLYLYRMTAGEYTSVRRMIMLK